MINNYKISDHFWIAEWVSKSTLEKWGSQAVLFIDPRIVLFMEIQRKLYGPLYMNNWIDGGNKDSRGYRSADDPDGAAASQHRFGRAADSVSDKYPAEERREEIIKNWDAKYRDIGVTRMELGTSWLHVDCGWVLNQQKIFTFNP